MGPAVEALLEYRMMKPGKVLVFPDHEWDLRAEGEAISCTWHELDYDVRAPDDYFVPSGTTVKLLEIGQTPSQFPDSEGRFHALRLCLILRTVRPRGLDVSSYERIGFAIIQVGDASGSEWLVETFKIY